MPFPYVETTHANKPCIYVDVDKSYFFFGEGGRAAAIQAACDHTERLQVIIENKLGRKLTAIERTHGLARKESDIIVRRDQREKWETIFNPPKEKDPKPTDPYQRMLQEHLAEQERAKDPKAAHLRELSTKWQAEQDEKERRAKLAASPSRQKLVKEIRALRVAAMFDQNALDTDVIELQNLEKLAEEGGDFSQVGNLATEWQSAYKKRLTDAMQPLQAKIGKTQAEIQNMTTPLLVPPSESVTVTNEENSNV
jgi:hypothetical protein